MYCRQPFVPSPYRPQQLVCSAQECQRRRRAEYHRWKRHADPVYRQVCRDSQKKWWDAHPTYKREYRQRHPDAVERNRLAQRRRDQCRQIQRLVKNNLAFFQAVVTQGVNLHERSGCSA